ncbi:MAG TPA: translation initiation factor IF-3 [Candidatus Sumerlaeota bacterium]|nr:translation initiation factor IF-3 [Candidatus Sumerlaeota bacterium]
MKQEEAANRLNEDIRVAQVRLVGPEGEKLGVVSIEDALRQAKELEMDLVEVAPAADPPVCRIIDYSKMLYEKQRKLKEARKHQRQVETKEVKLRPVIGKHDYEVKLQHIREFLLKGQKVKVTLVFRQREMRRFDSGVDVVNQIVTDVADIATRENPGRGQARSIIILLVPTKEIQQEAERLFKIEIEQRKHRDASEQNKIEETDKP